MRTRSFGSPAYILTTSQLSDPQMKLGIGLVLDPLKIEDSSVVHFDFDSIIAYRDNCCAIAKGGKAYKFHPSSQEGNEEKPERVSKNGAFVTSVCFGIDHFAYLTKDGDVYINYRRVEDIKATFIAMNCNNCIAYMLNDGFVIVKDESGNQLLSFTYTKKNPVSVWMTEKSVAVLYDDNSLVIKLLSDADDGIVIEDIVTCASNDTNYLILKSDSSVYELSYDGRKEMKIYGIGGTPISLFAGQKHYGAVTYEGDCYTWGWGLDGQLGNNMYMNSSRPVKVIVDDSIKIVAAAGGSRYSLFLVVKEMSFTPQFPPIMLKNEYINTVRTESIAAAAMNPENRDIIF